MTDYGRGNLVFFFGSDWSRVFTYLDPDGVTPINLTGYEARMQVRATASSTATILSLTSSPAAGITMGGALGTISVAVTNAQLTEPALDLSSITAPPAWVIETLDDGTRLKGYGNVGVFDLELIDGAGKVTRLYQGQCVFDAEVTRG